MKYTLEFDADNREEVQRVLATVMQLAQGLEALPASTDTATLLPANVVGHVHSRVTRARRQSMLDILSTELAERDVVFVPSSTGTNVGCYLRDVPDATYARVHPSRGTLRLPAEHATHHTSRAMTSETTAYGVAVNTTTAEGVREFHRLATIAAEAIKREFDR